MTTKLEILKAGPAMTVQDLGRVGRLSQGLTRGGAMDRLAVYEAAALLSQPITPALEMVGVGGEFKANRDLRFALTGAPMTATIDGTPIEWNGSHRLAAGCVLKIGGVKSGTVGYLTLGGGFDTPEIMGAQSAHLIAGIGAVLVEGQFLSICDDTGQKVDQMIVPDDRFQTGVINFTKSFQTELFEAKELQRFVETTFVKDARSNRQGARMAADGKGYASSGGLKVVSEIIVPGDIQIAGDGAPYVLMCESQSTGGYPRIGTVVPSDIPKVAQAQIGTKLQFRLLSREQAIEYERREQASWQNIGRRVVQRVRDPHSIPELLSYTLVSGAISATDCPLLGGKE